jgi:AcrR family transcriptional regulator
MTTKTAAYHHGDLRRALVLAALDLLERDGPAALTLRRLARAVGVSAMAPYHHFPSRADLLVAVAAEGFRRLQQHKIDALGETPDARAALVAGAVSHVRFVLAHPHLYRLMKGPDLADRAAHPDLQAAAAAPAASLFRLIGRLPFPGGHEDTVSRARTLWALVHGIGILALDGQIETGTAIRLAQEGATALIAGWSGGAVPLKTPIPD